MSGKGCTTNKPAPVPQKSQSPTLKRDPQKVKKSDDLPMQSTAAQPAKGEQHKKAPADPAKTDSAQPPTVDAKTAGSCKPNSGSSPQPPRQVKNDTNIKQPDHVTTEPNTNPTGTEHTNVGTPTKPSPSDVEKTQKSPNPEIMVTGENLLQPKDLDLGKTMTGIMDALVLLDKKEDAMREYQALLNQQKMLEAQLSTEKRKSLHENQDKLMEKCSKNKHDEISGPLYNSIIELKGKHPEKCTDALKELTFRRTLVEYLQGSMLPGQQQGGHVTHVEVGKQSARPAENKASSQRQLHNENEKPPPAKADESEPTSAELEQPKKRENQKDPEKFRVFIPEGYQLVKWEEHERMQYELANQRESIEELTSRLSAIASSKLKAGNPNIADLSDKNRPTKLGEHFAAMYDEQWSDAFEEMGKGKEEDEDEEEEIKSIDMLLDVVKESYRFCGLEADKQLQKIAMGMKDAVSLQQTTEQVATVDSEVGKEQKQDAVKQSGEDAKSGTQSTVTAKKELDKAPAPVSGQTLSKSDAASGQSKTKIGSPDVQHKQKPGAAGSQPGLKPGAAGGQPGLTPGAAGGQSKHKPGTAGGQPAQNSGATSGPSAQKSGAAAGPTGKTTPPDGEKKGETAETSKKSPLSETWQIALRCARSFRKETAMTAVTEIKQLFKDQYNSKLKSDPQATLPDALMKYIDRCVELMWLMAVQDPPMEIKWVDYGDRSDTNYFKFYQSKGKMVRQCVWPAVFLSANGGIVSKGYIIGMALPPPEQSQKKKAK